MTIFALGSSFALAHDGHGHHHHHHHHGKHAPAKAQPTSTRPLPLKVTGAAVMAVPSSIKDTAAYMTLQNTSAEPIVLVDSEVKVAGESMLMHTVEKNGLMGMIHAEKLVIPARGELTLKHDGDHVMLMKLKRPLVIGEKIEIILKADDGRLFTVWAVVQKH